MRGPKSNKLLTLLLFYCLALCSTAQDSNLFFHHITPSDQLEGDNFSGVFKDSKDLVWIGSSTAVNVFDGSKVKTFKNDTTEGLLNATFFNSFLEDKESNIWITSYNGIHLFERLTSTFHFFDLKESNYRALYIDPSNYLWLTINDTSVHRFNLTTKETKNTSIGKIDECHRSTVVLNENGAVERIITSFLLNKTGTGIQVYDINYDVDGVTLGEKKPKECGGFSTRNGIVINDTLWMGGVNGLLMMDLENFHYDTIAVSMKDEKTDLWDVEILDKNKLVISSNDGLYIFDKNRKKFIEKIKTKENHTGALLGNKLADLHKDENGVLWISDWENGINYVHLEKNQFDQIDGLVGKRVLDLTKDSEEKIWVSTANAGVFIFDKNGNLLQGSIKTHFGKKDNIKFQKIFSYQNQIWAISRTHFFKWNKNRFEYSHQDKYYVNFLMDEKSHLLGYVVTAGLYKIDLENHTSELLVKSSKIDSEKLINVFSFDFGKLYLSENNSTAIQILTSDDSVKTIDCRHIIYDFYQLPNSKQVLMATGTGLKILNGETFKIEEIELEPPLPSLIYFDIIEGPENEVWLPSNDGLVRYNFLTKKFKHYHPAHGLQGKIFKESNSLKTSNGKIWLGGNNGLNIFDPKKIKSFNPPVQIYFHEFSVNDQPYDLGKHIDNHTEPICLKYNQNSIKLEFAAIEYSDNENVKVAHRIKELSEEWTDSNPNGEITFFQRPKGTYTLEVKATSSEGGVPVFGKRIIEIAPPIWETWWFRLLFLVFALALLYWFYQDQLKKRLAVQEVESLKELDEFKNTIYTNVTHEFKTPITIIQGYVDTIQGHEKEKQIIQRSGEDLLRMVNQILGISKLQTDSLPIELRTGDVIAFLRHLIEPVESWAANEQKQFIVFFEKETWEIDFDEQKLQNIVMNLLSNAIKFTSAGGKIEMRVSEEMMKTQNSLKIEVQDSGVGIADEYQSQIFNRHFQVPKEKKMNKGGTGIGLAFCKELAELMGGTIHVESKEGEGSTFTVWLPTHYQYQPQAQLDSSKLKPKSTGSEALVLSNEREGTTDRPVILIIEDNRYVADIIRMTVSDDYKTLMAFDGKKGIELAEEHLPDLIISDVTMPEKDGFEVCEKLKNQTKTSHIPIILLTAKDSNQSRIEGLKRGADVYMTKPVDKELLLVHLSGQLKRLETLQTRYNDLQPKEAPRDEGEKIEDEFVKTLLDHIKSNLETVGPADLNAIVHMSRATLGRKLKVVTGKTPTQFINSIRLKIGKELLATTDKAIYQIADQVGFGSADHFSREFRNLFNCSPTEYRNGLNNN